MRMVDFPVDLPFTAITPTGGPQVRGSTVSETKLSQTIVDPFGGLQAFSVDIGPMYGAFARAFSRLSLSAQGGANCFRFNFYDPDEPTYRELGLSVSDVEGQDYAAWSNNKFWSNGKPWTLGKPLATISAASAKNAGTITIDTTEWGGTLPTFFGIVGHFAVYGITGATFSGNIATCRVWPPVRKAITTDDYATLRPVMAAKLTGPDGAPWSRNGDSMTGARLNIVEVLDETVRTYVTEDYP